MGFRNYAEYSLATKMADTPQQVIAFLRELASHSRDGELVTRFAESLGLRVVRGSASRGGTT